MKLMIDGKAHALRPSRMNAVLSLTCSETPDATSEAIKIAAVAIDFMLLLDAVGSVGSMSVRCAKHYKMWRGFS